MSLSSTLWIAAANDLVFLVPLCLVAGWLLGAREDAFFAFTAVVAGVVVSYVMGLFYAHPAPYQVHQAMVSGAPENAFPSQHTTVMFAFAFGALARRYRRVGVAFLALAVVVGVARVHVGYHWPLDIYGGTLAAVVGAGVTVAVGAWVDAVADVFVTVDDRLRAAAGLN